MESYEKKYNEALERMKSWAKGEHPECFSEAQKTAEFIFPELKESDDEKIRKAILQFFELQDDNTTYYFVPKKDIIAWLEKQGKEGYALKSFRDEDVHEFMQYIEKQAKAYEFNLPNRGYDIYAFAKDILHWLEKQGEKKSADKVEPKFRPGDWITDGHLTCKILSVTGKSYELHLYNDDYCHFETDVQSVDKRYHLWTIVDAKDGDVLVAKDDRPFIFTGEFDVQDDNPTAYCGINSSDKFITGNGSHWTFKDGIKPATKAQRGLLFQKIKEAGYEWDADKKELKKIEVVSKESEDERIRKEIIDFVKSRGGFKGDWIAWLEKQGNKSVNIDVESMVSSYEQRLESQGGTKYTPLVNMCLTSFRHGVENVLEELNLKKLEDPVVRKHFIKVKD